MGRASKFPTEEPTFQFIVYANPFSASEFFRKLKIFIFHFLKVLGFNNEF